MRKDMHDKLMQFVKRELDADEALKFQKAVLKEPDLQQSLEKQLVIDEVLHKRLPKGWRPRFVARVISEVEFYVPLYFRRAMGLMVKEWVLVVTALVVSILINQIR